MDEQRLPFPIHGTRLTGDGDPQRGVGEAARLLYFANLIAQTAGVPVYRLSRQTPYGQVTASVHGPLAFKTVHSVAEPEEPQEQEEVAGITRLVWLPEGFVITPRTAGAPDGFGMPPTPDGKGTPGGPLRQVIINRFKDNQYPDAVYASVMRDNKQEPDEKITMIAAGLFYMDWEAVEGEFSIGVALKDEWMPQFKRRFETNFAEPETDEWHCHRPMYELGADKEFQKAARDRTNFFREDVGRLPVGPAMRGTEGGMSEMILYAMKVTETQGHGSPLFPKGYEDLEARDARHAWGNGDGENLATLSPTGGGKDAALAFVNGWRTSPGHYANMVDERFDPTDKHYGSVDVAMRTDMRIVQRQQPPYDLDSPVAPIYPPAEGDSAAQMLQVTGRFVAPALCGGDGLTSDRFSENTGNKPQGHAFMPLQHMKHQLPDLDGQSAVTFRGRVLIINDKGSTTFAVLAARMVFAEDEPDKLRIITADRMGDGADKPVTITVREGLLCDFRKTQKVLSEFVLPKDVGVTSTVRFSESGDKAVFCYTVAEPCIDTVYWTSYAGERLNIKPPNWPPTAGIFRERQDPVTGIWYPGNYHNATTAGPGGNPDPDGTYYFAAPNLREFDEEDSEQYIWGDELHFVEWTASVGFQEILKQSVEIIPTGLQRVDPEHPDAVFASTSRRFDCQASYKLFADYVGEEMVFAEVHVDSWFVSQFGGSFGSTGLLDVSYQKAGGVWAKHNRMRRSLRGKFVFPDKTEMVFRHTDTGYDTRLPLSADENQTSGFFLQILYLDILRPKTAVFVRQDLSGSVRPKAKSSLTVCGKVVRTVDDCLKQVRDDLFMEAQDWPWGSASHDEYQMVRAVYDNASSWSGLIPYVIAPPPINPEFVPDPAYPFAMSWQGFMSVTQWFAGEDNWRGQANVSFIGNAGQRFPPKGPYKAALVSHGLGNALTGSVRGHHAWWKTPHRELIGPEIAMFAWDSGMPYIEVALYKDEHIVAGDVGATLGPEKDAWQNNDRYFYDASIDLKAITGLPDLKDNIMPIGVL